MTRPCALGMASALFVTTPLLAADILVPADHATIQAAIDAANDGDVVVVSPGTYPEMIDFDGKPITVRSTGGALVTTINAKGAGSVVTCDDAETDDTVLDGFTLTGGIGTLLGGLRSGGAILNSISDATFRNLIITGNTARNGAAIFNFVADPTLVNCLIYDNVGTAFSKGGAILNDTSNPVLKNCTITENSADDGGAFFNDFGVPRLINCIVWSNTPDSFDGVGEIAPIVSFSNIDVAGASPYPGEGNIKATPGFVNPAGNDYSLVAASQCIDRGDSTAIAAEAFEDVTGDDRGVDVGSVPDRGVAVFGLTVDMGAFEFQTGGGGDECPADIDGSGDVGFTDLLQILGLWGPCP
ncbi:MAG: hypothetical protein HKO59_02510 [Phycisphaerales bacterium]|nr:right-handed parallel beta-helix repeat-containing protein [Phycisphaerae bacterium]NNF41795.1 hypothetical protein [Phycisphaerales bacterium]NNM24854.1 hypothetical protein [Phycisphaerales bacterium]